MPMIALIDYCQFEDLPIERSKTYQTIKKFYGETYAEQFTYEVEVSLEGEPAGVDRTISYHT